MHLSILKGCAYIFVTSFIIFKLIKKILTKLINSKNELEVSNILMSSILESSPEFLVFSLDTNYCYTAYNTLYEQIIFNFTNITIKIGLNVVEMLIYDDDHGNQFQNYDRALNGESFNIITKYTLKNDSALYFQVYYSPIYSTNHEIIGLTCIAHNITALKEAEKENLYLSYHDQLTRLYNRRYYEETLKQIDVENNYPLSIIIADLNGLKFTNDVFGHFNGDKLIITFAKILGTECPKEAIISRIGGDEFGIILPNTNSIKAQRIIDNIKNSISTQVIDKSILSVSFGYATKYKSYETMEGILNRADDSMYGNKILDRDILEKKLQTHINSMLYDENPIEEVHAKEVSSLCKKIGIELELSQSKIDKLELTGLLHDIGNVGVNTSRKLNSSTLTEYELNEVSRHSEVGYRILNYLSIYKDIAEYVLYHHERIDGTGYPKGLKGNKIPLFSRIIAIADAYHSMTTNITYGKVMTPEEAAHMIKENAGTQFDSDIAQLFVEKVLCLKWE